MRVGIATDHGGFELKEDLKSWLSGMGHVVVDIGARELTPGDDYPDFVIPLAKSVAAGVVDRGVAVCGSGVGASVCANKIPGVRAALVHDHYSAHQGCRRSATKVPIASPLFYPGRLLCGKPSLIPS
jgi:ribose 5-phosphate isomerase B